MELIGLLYLPIFNLEAKMKNTITIIWIIISAFGLLSLVHLDYYH